MCRTRDAFRVFARHASVILGSAWAFCAAILIIVIWALTGPTFYFSDTWQLIMNTGTTIVTFLMVFLIRNTQNRDAKAVHFEILDELVAGPGRALEINSSIWKSFQMMNRITSEKFTWIRKKAETTEKKLQNLSRPSGGHNC